MILKRSITKILFSNLFLFYQLFKFYVVGFKEVISFYCIF